MGYVTFGEDQSVVSFTKGIFGFLALTGICVVITVGLWLVLHRRGKQHSNQADEEAPNEEFREKSGGLFNISS